jgi:hypothetical protein
LMMWEVEWAAVNDVDNGTPDSEVTSAQHGRLPHTTPQKCCVSALYFSSK